MTLFLTFVLSMMVTLILIPPFMKSATFLKIVDIPDDERKIHKGKIPRIGGLAMIIGVILPVYTLLSNQDEIIFLYAGLLTLLVFGVLDDRFQLNYKFKFLGQFLAILAVVLFGSVVIYKMPLLSDDLLPSYFAVPFTIFAMLGVTNAINLSDGLDGLAGGMSLLSLSGIALMAYNVENTVVLLLCIAVLGSILGFLRYNTFPARVFMGDTGSQFLGFTLGLAVILLTQHEGAMISTSVSLFLLGVPVLDTITVMAKRISGGRSPFSPDNNHIHHRLLAIGFHHHEAVLIIYIVQAMMVMAGYVLQYQSDYLILSSYLIVCTIIIGTLYITKKNNWLVHSGNIRGETSFFERNLHWLGNRSRLLMILLIATGMILGILFLSAVSFAERLPYDSLIMASIMGGVFFCLFIFRSRRHISWLERIVIYTLGAMVIFIIQGHTSLPAEIVQYQDMLFALLVVAVILGFRYSAVKTFEPTPLDFLVILAAIISAVLPEIQFISKELGLNMTRLIILFYALEFVLVHVSQRLDILRYGVFIALGILGFNGI